MQMVNGQKSLINFAKKLNDRSLPGFLFTPLNFVLCLD